MDDDFAESPFYVRQEALRREKEVKLSTEKANTLRYEKKMGASGPKMSFKSRKITKNQPRLVPSLSGIISERMAEREQLILAHVTEITTPRRYGHGTPRSTSPFYMRQEALRREKGAKLRYEKKMGASGPKMPFKSRKIMKNLAKNQPHRASLSGIISEFPKASH